MPNSKYGTPFVETDIMLAALSEDGTELLRALRQMTLRELELLCYATDLIDELAHRVMDNKEYTILNEVHMQASGA